MKKIHNPILPGFHPDPSILRVGEDYYIATSTFEWFPGVELHHSKDLIHWRRLPSPLNRLSQLDMRGNPNSGGVWAPCLSYADDLFYLVYTDVKSKVWPYTETHNYLVTGNDINGPWSEPIYLNASGFDPSLFHDEDGRKWLVNMELDHRKNREPMAGILLQEYSVDEKRLVGSTYSIFKGSEVGNPEGPHLYKRNGYYYLMVAEGGTWENHCITMARSKNLKGPYEVDPQNPILTAKGHPELTLQRSGHGSLVETEGGEWFIAHLCGRPLPKSKKCILGRETALQKVDWTKDGWLRLSKGGCFPYTEVAVPNLKKVSKPQEKVRDDFDEEFLGREYKTLRMPLGKEVLSLKNRKGFLRLKGKAFITSHFEQALVARRQEHFSYCAETCVEFEPENYKQMAGLVCLYDTEHFYYLRITKGEDNNKVLGIIRGNHGQIDDQYVEDRHINGRKGIYLKVKVQEEVLQFFYSKDGETWETIGSPMDTSILTDEHCDGFTGAFVGLCCQDLSGRRHYADFDYFEYVENK